MKQIFLLVDPKSHIRSSEYVLSRHLKYAEELLSVSQHKVLLIIISFRRDDEFKIMRKESLWLISFPIRILSLLRTRKMLRNQISHLGEIKILIAGDPWFGALSAYLTKKLLNLKVPIEIQIHADIGDASWREINSKNKLKYIWALRVLKKVDQVRCVSHLQAQKILSKVPSLFSKTVVIPVPSNLDFDSSIVDFGSRPLTIGFVGRIQEDRGLDKFVEVIEKLNSKRQDFKIVIAGSGEHSPDFLNKLERVVGQDRIALFGEVEPRKMGEIWSKIGVLLSCPQAESYGRTLREAISFGVPIWISHTSGGLDFTRKINSDYYELLNSKIISDEIARQFKKLSEVKIDKNRAAFGIEENEVLIRKLIMSWLNLAKKS